MIIIVYFVGKHILHFMAKCVGLNYHWDYGWDDTVELSIQKFIDTYRYGYNALPIQMMVTATATNLIESSGSIISHLTFIQLT